MLKKIKAQKVNIIVLLVFFGIALAFTYPAVIKTDTHLMGAPPLKDGLKHLWSIWWSKKAVLGLQQAPFYTNYLFYPHGIFLGLFLPEASIYKVAGIVFGGLFEPILIYNWGLILNYALSGFFCYLLIRYLIEDKVSAFLGGLTFGFSPYITAKLLKGHLGKLSVWVVPLYMFLFLRMKERRDRKSILLAGFGFFLVTTSSLYYTVILGLWSVVLIFLAENWGRKFISFFKEKGLKLFLKSKNKFKYSIQAFLNFYRSYSYLFKFGVIALLFLLPLVLPSLFFMVADNPPKFSRGHYEYSINLLSVFVPHPQTNLGRYFTGLYEQFSGNFAEQIGYIGTIELLLISCYLFFKKNREKIFTLWLWIGAVFLMISLGPVLKVANFFLLPLPDLVLTFLFPFSYIRSPNKFMVVALVAVAILTALSLKWLKTKLDLSFWRWLVGALLVVIMAERLLIPFPSTEIPAYSNMELRSAFEKIKKQDSEGVLVVPMPFGSKTGLMDFDQKFHGKKIVGGKINPRYVHIKRNHRFLSQQPFLIKFNCYQYQNFKKETLSLERFKQMLKINDIKHIILYKRQLKKYCPKKPTAFIRSYLQKLPVFYEGERVKIFRINS